MSAYYRPLLEPVVQECVRRASLKGVKIEVDLHFHDERALPAMVVRDRPLRLSICEVKCFVMPDDAVIRLLKQNMAMVAVYCRHRAREAAFNAKGGMHAQRRVTPQWGSPMWGYYDALFASPDAKP
jgi:hypothetical protein